MEDCALALGAKIGSKHVGNFKRRMLFTPQNITTGDGDYDNRKKQKKYELAKN